MRFKQSLSAGVFVCLIVVALIAVQYRDAQAQNSKPTSAPVTIVGPLPLPITDAGDAGRTPFQARISTNPGPNQFQLPSDRRLTIETLTLLCQSVISTITPGTFIGLTVTADGVQVSHTVTALSLTGAIGGYYGSTTSVRLYADPGTNVMIDRVFAGANCALTVSGFLSPA